MCVLFYFYFWFILFHFQGSHALFVKQLTCVLLFKMIHDCRSSKRPDGVVTSIH
jgi:hypothetical protein